MGIEHILVNVGKWERASYALNYSAVDFRNA
jgi:hypothetical protein